MKHSFACLGRSAESSLSTYFKMVQGSLRRKSVLAVIVTTIAFVNVRSALTQSDPNLAMNDPDQQAWLLFIEINANAATAGNNNSLFETWANDGDTFQPNPTWPTTPSNNKQGVRVLEMVFLSQQGQRLRPQVVPGGGGLISEETRRNRADFDFIVQNNLYKVTGLKSAFAAGKTISFPVDSIEVKANWVDVTKLKEFNGFQGTPAEAAKIYHVNSAGGKSYALVSFHIISKLVPNWTWATFEHKDNPGRCDVIGCVDSFGTKDAFVAPLSAVESGKHYPDCVKSPALSVLLAKARIDPAYMNYCLKASQSDFNDPSGLAIRVGNSVTEQTFVNQASCITCHGRSAFDATGHPTSFAGFDLISPTLGVSPQNTGNAPVGPILSSWYWQAGGPPSFPSLQREQDIKRIALPSDFVWSIPFCAIDDTAKPPETKSRFCANK